MLIKYCVPIIAECKNRVVYASKKSSLAIASLEGCVV